MQRTLEKHWFPRMQITGSSTKSLSPGREEQTNKQTSYEHQTTHHHHRTFLLWNAGRVTLVWSWKTADLAGQNMYRGQKKKFYVITLFWTEKVAWKFWNGFLRSSSYSSRKKIQMGNDKRWPGFTSFTILVNFREWSLHISVTFSLLTKTRMCKLSYHTRDFRI